MTLRDLWFVIIASSGPGSSCSRASTSGSAMLHSVRRPRPTTERRVAINTIGPFWDGNEVWLIVGRRGHLRGVPRLVRDLVLGAYLALLLLLVALIVRGVSFEFRGKRRQRPLAAHLELGADRRAARSSRCCSGSRLGDLLAGLPIDASEEFTGIVWRPASRRTALLDRAHAAGPVPAARRDVPGAQDRPGDVRARARVAGAAAGVAGRRRWCSGSRSGPSISDAGSSADAARCSASSPCWPRAACCAPGATGGRSPPPRWRSALTVGLPVRDLYPDVMVSSTERRRTT